MRKTKRNFVTTLFGLALAVGTAACDPADDPGGDTDSGGDTDNVGMNDGDGRRVRCCFFARNGSDDAREACVARNSPFHSCVDPASATIDPDGSGNVDESEFANFCQQKVPADISFPNPWNFPLLPPDEIGPLDINGPWVVATAYGGSFVGSSCVPHLNPTVDYPGAVGAPTHEGTFTSAAPQSSSVDVHLGGVHRLAAADGRFELAISDCKAIRQRETCELELRAMTLDLKGPLAFADYSLDTAVLSLEEVGKASVTFDCSDGLRCAGSFDFSTRNGTSLGILLEWDQTNLSTGSLGGGSLLLGENGLANMARVLGELDLDTSKKRGTLRLRGAGSDSFGGSFASIGFDVAGPVSTYAVP